MERVFVSGCCVLVYFSPGLGGDPASWWNWQDVFSHPCSWSCVFPLTDEQNHRCCWRGLVSEWAHSVRTRRLKHHQLEESAITHLRLKWGSRLIWVVVVRLHPPLGRGIYSILVMLTFVFTVCRAQCTRHQHGVETQLPHSPQWEPPDTVAGPPPTMQDCSRAAQMCTKVFSVFPLI